MDKCVVNNYILLMRDSVMQARNHLLNKLSREIKKLKTKKASEEQKQKNLKKAERIKQEIFLIKKSRPIEVSKFALLFKDNPEKVLQQDSISLEERVKVRLAAHKSIALQVEIFRAKYPDWELKLPPLLVQLGLYKKFKKNLLKTPAGDSTLKPVVKGSTENDEKENVSEHLKHNTKNKSSANTNSLENTITEVEGNVKEKKTNGVVEVIRFADLVESDCSKISRGSDKKTNTMINEIDKKKEKENGVGEVPKFADLMESGRSESSEEMEKDSSVKPEVPNPTIAIADPFFLTGDDSGEDDEFDRKDRDQNQNQINGSSSVRDFGRHKHVDRSSGNKNMYSSGDQKVPTLNRTQRRMLERAKAGKKGASFQSAKQLRELIESSTKKNLRSYQHREDLRKISAVISAEKEENLHPSWEAKRKQKAQQILPFQGKKIKFDDD